MVQTDSPSRPTAPGRAETLTPEPISFDVSIRESRTHVNVGPNRFERQKLALTRYAFNVKLMYFISHPSDMSVPGNIR
jgi:hypothetical protein